MNPPVGCWVQRASACGSAPVMQFRAIELSGGDSCEWILDRHCRANCPSQGVLYVAVRRHSDPAHPSACDLALWYPKERYLFATTYREVGQVVSENPEESCVGNVKFWREVSLNDVFAAEGRSKISCILQNCDASNWPQAVFIAACVSTATAGTITSSSK